MRSSTNATSGSAVWWKRTPSTRISRAWTPNVLNSIPSSRWPVTAGGNGAIG